MSLIQISGNISAFDLGATLIAVLKGPEGYTLIDSGMGKSHFKKIENALDAKVCSVIHTHFHSDHSGGTAYFCEKHGAKAYMPPEELSFALTPALNAALLFGGIPAKDFTKAFLRSAEFPAQALPGRQFNENAFAIEAVSTPGHSVGHTSYLIDGILFAGDALTSPDVISKHGILYMFNPKQCWETLELMQTLNFDKAVLCHKDVISKERFITYADRQKDHIRQLEQEVLLAVKANSAYDIANKVAKKLEVQSSAESWLLTTATVKGYLANLEAVGQVKSTFIESEGIIWSRN